MEVSFGHDCSIEDVAGLMLEIHTEKYGEENKSSMEKSVDRIKGFLAKPNSTEITLRASGELVGCVFSFEKEEGVFEIKGLNVKAKYRGRGFGRKLMEEIIEKTLEKGAKKMILSLPEKDPEHAKRLYEKLGFNESAPNQDSKHFYMEYGCPREK